MYITLTVLCLFSFTVLHEPQSGPPAQRFRHHWRWQLGYLRDCFITAWNMMYMGQGSPSILSFCGRQQPNVLPPSLKTPGWAEQETRTCSERTRQWLQRGQAAITQDEALVRLYTPAFWFLQYPSDRLYTVYYDYKYVPSCVSVVPALL